MIISRCDFDDGRCTASASNECLRVRHHDCNKTNVLRMAFEDLQIVDRCLSNYTDEQNAKRWVLGRGGVFL